MRSSKYQPHSISDEYRQEDEKHLRININLTQTGSTRP